MLKFSPFTLTHVDELMTIENLCHAFPWSKKVFQGCIGGRYINVMLHVDDALVGFYVADRVADESTLMDICVHPEQHGKGYGKQLLAHYIDHIKQSNITTSWLEVRASNLSAYMLYINAGYIETGRRTGYYPLEIGYEDAIVMSLAINS